MRYLCHYIINCPSRRRLEPRDILQEESNLLEQLITGKNWTVFFHQDVDEFVDLVIGQ
jgi:hypothetical protein